MGGILNDENPDFENMPTWEEICAETLAAGRPPPSLAVLITSQHHYMEEKNHLIEYTKTMSKDSDTVMTVILLSGSTLENALRIMSAPASAVVLLAISPHAKNRSAAIAGAQQKWPLALEGLDQETDRDAYIIVDLRPCTNTDPGHKHKRIRLDLPAHNS